MSGEKRSRTEDGRDCKANTVACNPVQRTGLNMVQTDKNRLQIMLRTWVTVVSL